MALFDVDRIIRLALVALAIALQPVNAFASNWPEADVPDGMATAATASHLIYNGIDMRNQVFTSPQSPAQIVNFYQKLWGEKSVLDHLSQWQVVGHQQGDFYFTVQVRADGKGSRGDIGIVRLPTEKKTVVLGQGVPHPSNTKVVNDIAYPDDATPARTLALINKLSIQQNASYYRNHLIATGWEPVEAKSCAYGATSCVMNYTQGDRKMTLALSANAGRSDIVINMMGKGVTP